MKIKGYNQFILENFNSNKFDSDFNDFMNIYQNEIVPKIGEVEIYTNLLLDDAGITKEVQSRFNYYRKNLIEARSEFAESIKSLSQRFFSTSFSKLAARISSNPDEDVEEMQKILNRAGFTLEILKKLFNPVVSVFISESFARFIHINSLDEENGYVDIYLFKLNEKLDLNTTIWLGGAGWGDALNENPEEEYVVRYSYGYHKTSYGKLFLDQMGISTKDFKSTAYSYLKDYLKENTYSSIIYDINRMLKDSGKDNINIDIDKYITFDDDRFIISYLEMCDDFNTLSGMKFSPDWFRKTILSNMTVFQGMNVQDTGDELIFDEQD